MNYKNLLKKYLDFVGELEGTDFLGKSIEQFAPPKGTLFTEAEVEALRDLADGFK